MQYLTLQSKLDNMFQIYHIKRLQGIIYTVGYEMGQQLHCAPPQKKNSLYEARLTLLSILNAFSKSFRSQYFWEICDKTTTYKTCQFTAFVFHKAV